MSISVLLSQYPRALLNNEKPLLVLAALERVGLGTSKEICAATGLSESVVNQELLRLHQNKLTVVAPNHISISDAGRALIEKFQLHDDLVDDFLDTLVLTRKQRAGLKTILLAYRRSSFSSYLSSMSLITQWRKLAGAIPQKSMRGLSALINIQAEVAAGATCLMFRDLHRWSMWSSEAQSIVSSLVENSISHALHPMSYLAVEDSFDFTWRASCQYERSFHHVSGALVVGSEEKKQELALWPLFRSFRAVEESWGSGRWFDAWSASFRAPDLSGVTRLEHVHEALTAALGFVLNPNALVKIDDWVPKAQHTAGVPAVPNDFLSGLLSARSISGLSSEYGISAAQLHILLQSIGSSCSRLLESEKQFGALKQSARKVAAEGTQRAKQDIRSRSTVFSPSTPEAMQPSDWPERLVAIVESEEPLAAYRAFRETRSGEYALGIFEIRLRIEIVKRLKSSPPNAQRLRELFSVVVDELNEYGD